MTLGKGRCIDGLALLLVAAAAGFGGGCDGSSTWANTEQDLELPAIGIHTVLVKTESGDVQVRPAADAENGIRVRAIIRAAGPDQVDAQECLDAIEIVTPTSGSADGVQEIRWEWSRPKLPQWRASVSFEVTLPAALDLQAETQNGKLDVAGVTGACALKSKNGGIRAWAVAAERLTVTTYNGELDVESPAGQIDLSTYNGRILAALTSGAVSKGRIESHNGEIRVSIDPAANVLFQCKTSNGRVTSRLPLRDVEQTSRKRLAGRLGEGGGTLQVATHNGNVRLEPIDPRRVELQYID